MEGISIIGKGKKLKGREEATTECIIDSKKAFVPKIEWYDRIPGYILYMGLGIILFEP